MIIRNTESGVLSIIHNQYPAGIARSFKKGSKFLLAIGGNSLIPTIFLSNLKLGVSTNLSEIKMVNIDSIQRGMIVPTVVNLAQILKERDVLPIITHGNGPQVGIELLKAERDRRNLTLAEAVKITQESIGGIIKDVLEEQLQKFYLKRPVKVFITHVLVDANDPAFQNPTKFIGPLYTEDKARELMSDKGWKFQFDLGRKGFRRVVPSPLPLAIVEIDEIKSAVENGEIVICAGGGGITVVKTEDGYQEIDAVIGKDFASALLAVELGTKLMVISTGERWVYNDFGTLNQRPLRKITLGRISRLRKPSEFTTDESGNPISNFDIQFPAGSIGPKIEAAEKFLKGSGRKVIITSDKHLADLNGTKLVRGIEYYLRRMLRV